MNSHPIVAALVVSLFVFSLLAGAPAGDRITEGAPCGASGRTVPHILSTQGEVIPVVRQVP